LWAGGPGNRGATVWCCRGAGRGPWPLEACAGSSLTGRGPRGDGNDHQGGLQKKNPQGFGAVLGGAVGGIRRRGGHVPTGGPVGGGLRGGARPHFSLLFPQVLPKGGLGLRGGEERDVRGGGRGGLGAFGRGGPENRGAVLVFLCLSFFFGPPPCPRFFFLCWRAKKRSKCRHRNCMFWGGFGPLVGVGGCGAANGR